MEELTKEQLEKILIKIRRNKYDVKRRRQKEN